MQITKDVVAASLEDTVDIAQLGSWFGCRVEGLVAEQPGLPLEAEKEPVSSGFVTWVARAATAQAQVVGPYLANAKWGASTGMAAPIFRMKEQAWSSSGVVYVVGGTYFPGAAVVVPDTGTEFALFEGRTFTIGCRTAAAATEIKLPGSLEERLDKIAGLPEKWDSYSASRISTEAIRKAKSLLIETGMHCGASLLEDAFVAPCSDGGIQLEWSSESESELIVKISSSPKEVTFLLTDSFGKEEEGTIRTREDLNKVLDEFCERSA